MPSRKWEKFEKKKVGRTAQLRVSLQKGGRIAFNKAATRELLEDVNYVELYYENNEELIGIKPVTEATVNTYRVQYNESFQTAAIAGKSFLAFIKHLPEKAARYQPRVEQTKNGSRMIVIDLKKPLNVPQFKQMIEDISGDDNSA